jgi:hypothetical protein
MDWAPPSRAAAKTASTETGRGIVVLTGSDNGTTLATALIRRAADAYKWRPLGPLLD